MEKLAELVEISRRKAEIDKAGDWGADPILYLNEIKNEVDEVLEELPKQRLCYLEDELADVLWDYINAVIALEANGAASIDSVLERACRKYQERVSAIESGKSWESIKEKQKRALKLENGRIQSVGNP
ncbi:nucleotide pyrophosphohydrolase [Vibrio sp. S4M6]|uniref:MazG nucleotide pyrophosphohydrolase domain-containing protein n=1 Tax=Vibrio sinus TaxID=2946865 RepID=UPI002029E1E3|nr:MazG nucleotide pyrophosphohydrolase domain-containing protein [Vibrio sinus]MCL9783973.1 nucleotide pyrophosphohydrolase [Vibrio sinus]